MFGVSGNSQHRRGVFVNSGVSILVPLYDISRRGVAGSPQGAHLLRSNIFASTVLRSESRLWLEAIYRRLVGKRRIRTPFQAEITRDIPHEFFGVLCRFNSSRAQRDLPSPSYPWSPTERPKLCLSRR